jgi:hypothetical protein
MNGEVGQQSVRVEPNILNAKLEGALQGIDWNPFLQLGPRLHIQS